MSYFQAVRIYSACELALFMALLVVWIGEFSEEAEMVLGWSHGIGWIILCLLIIRGALRGIFSWPVVAAAVSPLGPLGSTVAIEIEARRRHVPA